MCLGIGGSSAKTDRTTQLDAEGKLRNLFGTLGAEGSDLLKRGTGTTAEGVTGTEKAAKYYSDILSGDPTKVLAAARPEVSAITGGAEQQKKELANLGGARTGGTNAATQDLATKTRGEVGDVLAKERTASAGGVERTGSELSRVGLAETGEGLGAQGQQAAIASQLETSAIGSRGKSQAIHDAAVQQWADLVAGILTA